MTEGVKPTKLYVTISPLLHTDYTLRETQTKFSHTHTDCQTRLPPKKLFTWPALVGFPQKWKRISYIRHQQMTHVRTHVCTCPAQNNGSSLCLVIKDSLEHQAGRDRWVTWWYNCSRSETVIDITPDLFVLPDTLKKISNDDNLSYWMS